MSIKEGYAALEIVRRFKGEAPGEPTLIVIESPYRAATGQKLGDNIELAIAACRYAIELGYNPFASHLYYPIFLDDNKPAERMRGIGSGFAWGALAKEVWFIIREGEWKFSAGMAQAFHYYVRSDKIIRLFTTSDNGKSFLELHDWTPVKI